MLRKGVISAALILWSGISLAQTEEPEGPWSGSVSLGYLSTSGNTETTSFNTAFGVGYAAGNWKHGLSAQAVGSEESSETTAESYKAAWQTDYNFTEFDFIFGTVDWRKDRFSGVDQQVTETVGYGRRVIDTPNHLLSLGLGVGHRSADLADGTSESGFITRGSVDYNWIFSETAGFDQNFIVETGSDNTYFESISAVRARLIGGFQLVLSYTVRQNSDVPVGSEKRDTLSAVSVEYVF